MTRNRCPVGFRWNVNESECIPIKRRFKTGDRVKVKGGKGWGNSIGTVSDYNESGGWVTVDFTTLRERTIKYKGVHGVERETHLKKEETSSFRPSELKKVY